MSWRKLSTVWFICRRCDNILKYVYFVIFHQYRKNGTAMVIITNHRSRMHLFLYNMIEKWLSCSYRHIFILAILHPSQSWQYLYYYKHSRSTTNPWGRDTYPTLVHHQRNVSNAPERRLSHHECFVSNVREQTISSLCNITLHENRDHR